MRLRNAGTADARLLTERLSLTHRLSRTADLSVSSYRAPSSARVVRINAAYDLARRVAGAPSRPSEAYGHARRITDLAERIREGGPLEHVAVSIDGESVELELTRAGVHWAAVRRLGEIFLQLDGSNFPRTDLALCHVTDLAPYLPA
ncbi:hypothetical protein [Nonomuraea sp. NPDC050643]|uniref:hypothetical protein n=1 Tax=Nonomuraea sp. NPDC050643 TaxID=3155660 RepID=UPI0034031EBE